MACSPPCCRGSWDLSLYGGLPTPPTTIHPLAESTVPHDNVTVGAHVTTQAHHTHTAVGERMQMFQLSFQWPLEPEVRHGLATSHIHGPHAAEKNLLGGAIIEGLQRIALIACHHYLNVQGLR